MNYLRVRGEYPFVPPDSILVPELPPRARRILQRAGQVSVGGGTTSACAENTSWMIIWKIPKRNYLRVRGEYANQWPTPQKIVELPPRARRILCRPGVSDAAVGTTSACAENTVPPGRQRCRRRNYLRVRGEYITIGRVQGGNLELPPRARRILDVCECERISCGTTSACAENTPARSSTNPRLPELPPRARRILTGDAVGVGCDGTTSACAENTLNELGLL